MKGRFGVILSGVLLALLLLVSPRPAAAQCAIGYNCMQVTGGISAGTAATSITPASGQQILVIDTTNYEFLPSTCTSSSSSVAASTTGACGTVQSDNSSYLVSIIEPSGFADTLELALGATTGQSTVYYPLQTTQSGTNSSGATSTYTFAYSGTAIASVANLFSIAQTTQALYVGAALTVIPVTEASTSSSTTTTSPSSGSSSSTTTSTAAICPTTYTNCDVNGDGVFDKNDIAVIKGAIDLIDAMRALAKWQADQVKGNVGTGSSSSGTTSSTTGSTATGSTSTGQ